MAAEEFVIRMIDGNYYAGGTVREGNLRWCGDAERAERFASRWQALAVATQGIVFARATILSVSEACAMPKRSETPQGGMQGQQ